MSPAEKRTLANLGGVNSLLKLVDGILEDVENIAGSDDDLLQGRLAIQRVQLKVMTRIEETVTR
jgi:hypothetical protein